jgi:hypothetical protein
LCSNFVFQWFWANVIGLLPSLAVGYYCSKILIANRILIKPLRLYILEKKGIFPVYALSALLFPVAGQWRYFA